MLIQGIISLKPLLFGYALVKKLGVQLIVGSVQEAIDTGRAKEETGADASRNALQIVIY